MRLQEQNTAEPSGNAPAGWQGGDGGAGAAGGGKGLGKGRAKGLVKDEPHGAAAALMPGPPPSGYYKPDIVSAVCTSRVR